LSFDGAIANMSTILLLAEEEAQFWSWQGL